MAIANFENVVSNAERRGILHGENPVVPRISDLAYLAASTRGKIELNLSEDEGQEDRVIGKLIGEAVKNVWEHYFNTKQFRPVVEWFENNKTFTAGDRTLSTDYVKRLSDLPALKKEVDAFLNTPDNASLAHDAPAGLAASVIELILEGLHVANRLNKSSLGGESIFKR